VHCSHAASTADTRARMGASESPVAASRDCAPVARLIGRGGSRLECGARPDTSRAARRPTVCPGSDDRRCQDVPAASRQAGRRCDWCCSTSSLGRSHGRPRQRRSVRCDGEGAMMVERAEQAPGQLLRSVSVASGSQGTPRTSIDTEACERSPSGAPPGSAPRAASRPRPRMRASRQQKREAPRVRVERARHQPDRERMREWIASEATRDGRRRRRLWARVRTNAADAR
jgi:hypothetical protein